ncbi:hypothetical protein TYRP_018932 [Tyrophagus putrescentiae]|nr:hypothetical protein TYRP_018932 [Tyrophagus putrescentiae]
MPAESASARANERRDWRIPAHPSANQNAVCSAFRSAASPPPLLIRLLLMQLLALRPPWNACTGAI